MLKRDTNFCSLCTMKMKARSTILKLASSIYDKRQFFTYFITCIKTSLIYVSACRRQYDMVFLLDFSGSVEQAYNRTISFVRRVVFGLEFRFDRVRLGVATYADNADAKFNVSNFVVENI